ncbi:hypothetical protein X777_10601 [Ooceraea biroi]|uniref:Transposase domain-containing protein n=1 Tax=Ooceraea biroi TaxID=2015173 RepID=A0A026W4M1_OOCBI|nr:hypothetical protein X777_10601 [Ooceraea biroi]
MLLTQEEERNLRKERQKNLNLLRRRLRDTQDPFDIPDSLFFKLYRLPKIFATLYFLLSSSYQRKVEQDYLSCMSRTSISVSIHATINALNRIMGQWIHFPTSNRREKCWPILGQLIGIKNEPFIIAIYFGTSDPTNVQEFLQDFINEAENLITNGYVRNETTYDFAIRHYILDAPARDLIKCCVGHNGYASCEKCTVWGERFDHRQTYIDLHAPLRTDETFKNQMQPRHHRGVSPLLQINTKMISQFRLEPMHLVNEGVFKRLLEVWRKWTTPWKLHWTVVNRISDKLLLLASSCPQDFVRKPRSLNELPFYKATEFRRLCLYDGIVVFASHVDINIYKHFLLLHCGIYILTSPILYKTLNAHANTILRTFIEHSVTIYGKSFVVYNVHSLCHLAQECNDHDSLDTFSAFRYENKLKTIKSHIDSGFQPVQQAAKREVERSSRKVVVIDSEVNKVILSKEHRDMNETIHGEQFRKILVNDVIFEVNKRNSCFKTNTGEIVVLKNIICTENDIIFVGNIFSNVSDFYTYPLPSSELGIVKVSELSEERLVFSLNNIIAKCWLIPMRNKYVCIPLLHTFVVIKFINDNEDYNEEDDTLFEVGLTKWLAEKVHDDMSTKMSWPPRSEQGIAFKRKLDTHPSWPIYNVVLKCYGMLLLITCVLLYL